MLSRSKNKSPTVKSIHFRLGLIRFGVLFLFIILGARLFYVQGLVRTDLQLKAQKQHPQSNGLKGLRSSIRDRNFNSLVDTAQVYSCYLDPSMVNGKMETAKKLATALDLNPEDLKRKIKKTTGSFLWIKRNVSPAQIQNVVNLNLRGVGFKTEYRRTYPLGKLASHLIGLVGVDGRGLSGIELGYEKTLNPGKLIKEIKSGDSPSGEVVLTIDGAIQEIVEKELAWGVAKIEAQRGMAIVQNPWTGEILAMAAWPPLSLDPDQPPHPTELRIPALVDVFEPGSTFKIVTAAAAIEENIFNKNEKFTGENGAWPVADITIHDHEPRKLMTFEDIWIYSSNIGSAKVADKLGSHRLYQYARSFGFGVFPGTGLAGEAKGTLRTSSQWSGISKHVVSFGQEVGVTAIQLVGAYSAVANGGDLMEPKLVSGIINEEGKYIWKSSPSKVRRVISKESALILKDILTSVVNQGTGRRAQLLWNDEIKVAGKTGTAQKFDSKQGRYCNELSILSFCGIFPAQNPQYTVLIILDEPKGKRWGGIDAAPVFRRIAEQLVPTIGI